MGTSWCKLTNDLVTHSAMHDFAWSDARMACIMHRLFSHAFDSFLRYFCAKWYQSVYVATQRNRLSLQRLARFSYHLSWWLFQSFASEFAIVIFVEHFQVE